MVCGLVMMKFTRSLEMQLAEWVARWWRLAGLSFFKHIWEARLETSTSHASALTVGSAYP